MKRIALCIGNDAYSILPPLKCAIADATAMEKELKTLSSVMTEQAFMWISPISIISLPLHKV